MGKEPPKTITSAEFRKQYVKPKRTPEQRERREQAALCKYIKHQYPKVLYTVDLAGINLSESQRKIHQSRAMRGHPDLMFQEWYKDKYCGLAIEFKAKGEELLNEKGKLRNEHLTEQQNYLVALRERCWFAVFVCGFDNAKKVIDCYMEGGDLSKLNSIIY